MTGKPTGIATVLAEMLANPQDSGDGQAELFDPADFGDDLPGPMAPVAKSGPEGGRPKGARNKSTEQIRRYIAQHYKHPLIVLAEMWSKTPKQIAQEMELYELKVVSDGEGAGSSVRKFLATGQAAALQQQAVIAALPYLAQKLPLEITQKITQRGIVLTGDLSDLASIGKMIDQSPLGGDGE